MKLTISRKYFNASIQWTLAVVNAMRNEPLPESVIKDLEASVNEIGHMDWQASCKVLATATTHRGVTIGWNDTELVFDLNDEYLLDTLNCFQPELVGRVVAASLHMVAASIQLGECTATRIAALEAKWR